MYSLLHQSIRDHKATSSGGSSCNALHTVEPHLIVTEMLAFPSKASGNKNDSNLMIAIP